MIDTLKNESTTAPTVAPQYVELSSQGRIPTNTASGTAITFILLFVCLFLAVMWAFYAARSYNSPRVAEVGDKQQKKLSVEDYYKAIVQRFHQLGNSSFLTKESFRPDEPPPQQQPPELLERDDSDSSHEETLSNIDLEEGPADYDGQIVVSRRFNDNTTEEVAAPNCCAICLESYSCGDEVVLSANEKCQHVYHKDCIAAYFSHAKKRGKKKCLCPTCRQEYLVLEEESIDKSKSDDESEIAVASSIVESTFRTRQHRVEGL
ncbi:ring finger domain containing protein [Nitzschia inconspicua]|uniref:Ring finger domain containing protein n=1 Tax=Nitzschia inconspicua TaxID=303405 RepID=A0A9K3KSP8_9STRA|nr:ring finger domain containing protein [Nitzschia inconspicua]